MPAIYHEGSWLGNATDPEVLVKDTVGWTGKNLLKNTATNQTISGVTFTVNNDGTITANGTATTDIIKTIGIFNYVSESLILTGCPSNGAWNTYRLDIRNENNIQYGNYLDTGNGVTFTPGENYTYVCLRIGNGTTVSNLVFKPMIRKADITDPTYEPYHESVEEEIEQIYADNGVLGTKNLLENTASTRTINGVTFTVNADKSVTANGTATADATFTLLADYADLEKGVYKITGCPTGGTATTYEIFTAVRHLDATATEFVRDFGNGASLTVDNNTRNIALSIIVRNNTTVSNIVFKPMIRLASDPDDTYQPYAMTNRELTEKLNTKKSSATDTVGTITNNKIYKQNAYVFFVFESNALTLAVNDVIAKIPEGYRPPVDFSIHIPGDKTIRFQRSGDVVTLTAFSNENIRLSASWITA